MTTRLKFTVASSPGHYAAAQRLLRNEGIEDKQGLSFPTIMAWDGAELVGICGTRIIDKMIVAGPLMVLRDRPRLFTIMRLCEAYEVAMGQIGIESYIFSAERGSILQRGLERYMPHMTPYASHEGDDFYIWKVGSYGNQRQSAGSIGRGASASEEPSRTAGPSAPDH